MTEIRALTGIRGIAALWVLFLHFEDELCALFPGLYILHPLVGKGNAGVDVFFVLSGYIISYAYRQTQIWTGDRIWNFIVNRFSRIYPMQLVTLLILGGMVLTTNALGKTITGNYSASDFLANLFMLQGIPGIPEHEFSWNYPSWSVSVEFFGYLVAFPLSILIFKKPSPRKASLLICFLCMTSYVTLHHGDLFGDWFKIFQFIFEFLAGAALFHALSGKPGLKAALSVILPLIIVVLTALCYVPEHILPYRSCVSILVLAIPLIIGGLSSDAGFFGGFLGSKPMRYLGLISYSVYMVHALVEKVFKVILSPEKFSTSSLSVRFLVLMIYIISPIILASGFYKYVEEPARKLLQRRFRRPEKTTLAVPTSTAASLN